MTVRRWLRGRFGDARLWLRIVCHLIRPEQVTVAPVEQPQPMMLMGHAHVWDRCRLYGQYWFARCVAYEWCTAKIAC